MSLFFYKDEGTFGRADALLFSYFAYILNDTQNKHLNGSIMGSFISLYFYRKMVYLFKDLIEDI